MSKIPISLIVYIRCNNIMKIIDTNIGYLQRLTWYCTHTGMHPLS